MNNERPFPFELHYVLGEGWLHTHGMDALGLPEIEVRHVPAFLANAASSLVRDLCLYAINEDVRFERGQTMWVSERARIVFIQPEPIPGQEGHYEVDRLQITDFEPICDCCRTSSCERPDKSTMNVQPEEPDDRLGSE